MAESVFYFRLRLIFMLDINKVKFPEVNKQLQYCIFCAVATIFVSSANSAENLRNFSNQEFGFAFQYPVSWSVSPTLTPNSRAKVVSPTTTPHAECAVIVQRLPQTSSASQADLDQIMIEPWPPSEFKNALSQSCNDVEIVAVSVGILQIHPAQLARVRYSMGTQYGKAFISGRMAMTATPGFTWTLSCGGQGDTPSEAEKSFQFWQVELNRIVSSFQFR
jgi:hypothetical protein